MNKKYTKRPVGFGAKKNKSIRESALERGRLIIGVTKDDDSEQLDFSYTIPAQGVDEPVLLTSYPSKKTVPWLLNNLGDQMRGHDWRELSTDHFTRVDGLLGEGGLIPLNVRLLNADELKRCQENLTVQAPEYTPVVYVQLPDPGGHFPTDPDCHEQVRFNDLMLFSRFAIV